MKYIFKQLTTATTTATTATTMTKRITIRNIGKHIKYDEESLELEDEEPNCYSICFVWDCRNEKIDDIANKEFRYNISDKKKNLMWINELKRVADWKQGEYIYAYTKTNGDGYYNVYFKKDKINFNWYNLIIEPKGFVCMECFNLYTTDRDDDIKYGGMFVRVNSVYNDKLSLLN